MVGGGNRKFKGRFERFPLPSRIGAQRLKRAGIADEGSNSAFQVAKKRVAALACRQPSRQRQDTALAPGLNAAELHDVIVDRCRVPV